MTLCSVPRRTTFVPRLHTLPQPYRHQHAPYSHLPHTSLPGSEEQAYKLLQVLRRAAAPPEEGPARKESFKTMNGKFMEPISVRKAKERCNVSFGTLASAGLKPLKDILQWQRSGVSRLAHGLEAVLSRPGVHWLKDPETNTYNFDHYLEHIPRVDEFAFDRLDEFVPSSRDKNMLAHALRTNCKYAGSTSSLTGILSQIYLLLSEEKYVNISNLSTGFDDAPRFFTPGQRIPVSVILRYQDGIYTTDIDRERDTKIDDIILLPLGTLLEKFLTFPKQIFAKYLKSYTQNDHPKYEDVHRYAKHGKFLMRSQLDCISNSLPGTGVFDLKTRAISPIRHDVYNYLSYTKCTLDSLTGRHGTFEEEYYDMIRAAFLEYSFQARIGNMDGVLVAYHNTARIFGFQYISLREMDTCLYGRGGAGDRVFILCVSIMQLLYDQIARCFPAKSVKCTFEKRGNCVRVWVEPFEHDDAAGPAPIVELALTIQNIMHGKTVRGSYAVYADFPWSVEYSVKRLDGPEKQDKITARRNKAYARQSMIQFSTPADGELQPAASIEELQEAEKGGTPATTGAKPPSRHLSRANGYHYA